MKQDPAGVILRFQRDAGALQEAREVDAPSLAAGILEETVLEMPVRLSIGDLELIGDVPPRPIIYVALAGLKLLGNLPTSKVDELVLPGGGGLVLRIEGADVIVQRRGTQVEGRASYKVLVQVWETFDAEVREFLLGHFPSFRNHLELGPWFRGECYPPTSR